MANMTVFKKADLQRMYLSAKIAASPFDYTVSGLLYVNCSEDQFHIFRKNSSTERKICDTLGLKLSNYLMPRKSFKIPSVLPKGYLYNTPSNSIMLTYNEVRVLKGAWESRVLAKYIMDTRDKHAELKDWTDISDKLLLDSEQELKAYLTTHIAMCNKGSLIPNLMYLGTELHDKSLNDLEELTVAREYMARGEAPLMRMPHDPISDENDPRLTYFYMSFTQDSPGILYRNTDIGMFISTELMSISGDLANQISMFYAYIYTLEILYQLSKLHIFKLQMN